MSFEGRNGRAKAAVLRKDAWGNEAFVLQVEISKMAHFQCITPVVFFWVDLGLWWGCSSFPSFDLRHVADDSILILTLVL
ncbi:hypothetical protein GG681_13475 [Epibacterium sp. SM1969]|uniref:Uncharacterized protein n=1 Tax=Tritonibacter aquimaris TaxID=2663379 RepID=A0A844B0K4_9RHOB|nr:hypothetical protein [Tritonibacter aquimaris]MQY43651.1 hypothetical protein [Tritonibacter aquimaris]